MINVTKPFLPPQEEYNKMIDGIWERVWLTNNGPLAKELEEKIRQYLDVSSMHFVTNGTMALQLAIKALDLKGEVITTPFSFVATTTAILWEKCTPVFVDIRPDTLCIDVDKIEEAITGKTSAILATHVYGIPCDVEKIEKIAKKHNLKVIYDAAHAFGVKYKGKSILRYGDISTLSFHATKLYHTIEGGGIINNDIPDIDEKINLLRNFGLNGEKPSIPGINAKNSEFHAAMGLCNLKYVNQIIEKRKNLSDYYSSLLPLEILPVYNNSDVSYNYAYYPIILPSEDILKKVVNVLLEKGIQTRRYFWPSLSKLEYIITNNVCEVAEDISKRILCLPLYTELDKKQIELIAEHVNVVLQKSGE